MIQHDLNELLIKSHMSLRETEITPRERKARSRQKQRSMPQS